MGHIRLGQLPRTRKWRDVVELVAAGADIPQIANATIKAAESAFLFVRDDSGYNHAVWLMVQLGLASHQAQPLQHLRSHGIDIPDNTSLPGVAVALTEALDNHSAAHGPRSDFGELAQRALVDAVIKCLEPKLAQELLYDMQSDETQKALAEFRKPKEFGRLACAFYSRLTTECMNYFLSQTLATNLGAGQRFPTTNQMEQFERALATHCREASAIVEQFAGD